jgi:hypothetical protein
MEVLGGLVLHLAGGAAFALREASTWEPWHYVAWSVVLLAGKIERERLANDNSLQ